MGACLRGFGYLRKILIDGFTHRKPGLTVVRCCTIIILVDFPIRPGQWGRQHIYEKVKKCAQVELDERIIFAQ
jgi:hypothetical protein